MSAVDSDLAYVGELAEPDELDEHAEADAWEVSKLLAFLRRDFLIAWSYRTAFAADIGNLLFQTATFFFVGKMVNPKVLPVYGGSHASYLEFVAVGILLNAVVEVGLTNVAQSIRQEQLVGTLESVLLTPTAIATIQTGSVAYPMVYIPIRTALFLTCIATGFGLHFHLAGILPAIALVLVFLPFVWGLGIVGAGSMLTFRRGGIGISFLSSILVLGSGAFFPLSLLPHWVQTLSNYNPIARTVNSLREALIGGSTAGLSSTLLMVWIASCLAFAAGLFAFRLALARERRRGTLGVY